MKNKPAFVLIITFFLSVSLHGQEKHESVIAYIDKHSDLAVDQMKRYKIPASITLAQAILESGAGGNGLVLSSNNHFGIKCGDSWKGKSLYWEDDGALCCFRIYHETQQSYEDHSLFLSERERYKELFSYPTTDYKAWANGLQSCGYATDKKYAAKLIRIIENYDLSRFDKMNTPQQPVFQSNPSSSSSAVDWQTAMPPINSSSAVDWQTAMPPVNSQSASPVKSARRIYKNYNLHFVFAEANDSYEQVAKDMAVLPEDLLKFNDVEANIPLKKGAVVYLEKKKERADKPCFEHVVEKDESMHDISQRYGVLLERLLKMNKKDKKYVPKAGDVLKLR